MMISRARVAGALAMLAAVAAPAGASEDTDTPGTGRWEINLGIAGERHWHGWELAAPAADVNYGLGERGQLVLGVERLQLHERGQPRTSGMGTGMVGYKWRFLDQEESGFALALFPQYSWNLSADAERRGLVEPGSTLAVPLIAGLKRGATGWYAQAGPSVGEHGFDEWQAGLKITHQCAATVECRVELEHSLKPRQFGHTQAGAGFKWTVADGLILQATLGRDLRPPGEEKHRTVLYVGIQLLR